MTVTGSGFAGATAVTFNGLPAAFSVVSAAAITATVPAGATSGPVAVTTTGGTSVSATSYAVVPQAAAALSLTVAPAAVAPGGAVKASGLLTPVSLSGSPVRLSVQRKKSGAWVTVKTVVVATKTSGAFAWTYRPARTGPYRVKASIAATVAHTSAQTSVAGLLRAVTRARGRAARHLTGLRRGPAPVSAPASNAQSRRACADARRARALTGPSPRL